MSRSDNKSEEGKMAPELQNNELYKILTCDDYQPRNLYTIFMGCKDAVTFVSQASGEFGDSINNEIAEFKSLVCDILENAGLKAKVTTLPQCPSDDLKDIFDKYKKHCGSMLDQLSVKHDQDRKKSREIEADREKYANLESQILKIYSAYRVYRSGTVSGQVEFHFDYTKFQNDLQAINGLQKSECESVSATFLENLGQSAGGVKVTGYLKHIKACAASRTGASSDEDGDDAAARNADAHKRDLFYKKISKTVYFLGVKHSSPSPELSNGIASAPGPINLKMPSPSSSGDRGKDGADDDSGASSGPDPSPNPAQSEGDAAAQQPRRRLGAQLRQQTKKPVSSDRSTNQHSQNELKYKNIFESMQRMENDLVGVSNEEQLAFYEVSSRLLQERLGRLQVNKRSLSESESGPDDSEGASDSENMHEQKSPAEKLADDITKHENKIVELKIKHTEVLSGLAKPTRGQPADKCTGNFYTTHPHCYGAYLAKDDLNKSELNSLSGVTVDFVKNFVLEFKGLYTLGQGEKGSVGGDDTLLRLKRLCCQEFHASNAELIINYVVKNAEKINDLFLKQHNEQNLTQEEKEGLGKFKHLRKTLIKYAHIFSVLDPMAKIADDGVSHDVDTMSAIMRSANPKDFKNYKVKKLTDFGRDQLNKKPDLPQNKLSAAAQALRQNNNESKSTQGKMPGTSQVREYRDATQKANKAKVSNADYVQSARQEYASIRSNAVIAFADSVVAKGIDEKSIIYSAKMELNKHITFTDMFYINSREFVFAKDGIDLEDLKNFIFNEVRKLHGENGLAKKMSADECLKRAEGASKVTVSAQDIDFIELLESDWIDVCSAVTTYSNQKAGDELPIAKGNKAQFRQSYCKTISRQINEILEASKADDIDLLEGETLNSEFIVDMNSEFRVDMNSELMVDEGSGSSSVTVGQNKKLKQKDIESMRQASINSKATQTISVGGIGSKYNQTIIPLRAPKINYFHSVYHRQKFENMLSDKFQRRLFNMLGGDECRAGNIELQLIAERIGRPIVIRNNGTKSVVVYYPRPEDLASAGVFKPSKKVRRESSSGVEEGTDKIYTERRGRSLSPEPRAGATNKAIIEPIVIENHASFYSADNAGQGYPDIGLSEMVYNLYEKSSDEEKLKSVLDVSFDEIESESESKSWFGSDDASALGSDAMENRECLGNKGIYSAVFKQMNEEERKKSGLTSVDALKSSVKELAKRHRFCLRSFDSHEDFSHVCPTPGSLVARTIAEEFPKGFGVFNRATKTIELNKDLFQGEGVNLGTSLKSKVEQYFKKKVEEDLQRFIENYSSDLENIGALLKTKFQFLEEYKRILSMVITTAEHARQTIDMFDSQNAGKPYAKGFLENQIVYVMSKLFNTDGKSINKLDKLYECDIDPKLDFNEEFLKGIESEITELGENVGSVAEEIARFKITDTDTDIDKDAGNSGPSVMEIDKNRTFESKAMKVLNERIGTGITLTYDEIFREDITSLLKKCKSMKVWSKNQQLHEASFEKGASIVSSLEFGSSYNNSANSITKKIDDGFSDYPKDNRRSALFKISAIKSVSYQLSDKVVELLTETPESESASGSTPGSTPGSTSGSTLGNALGDAKIFISPESKKMLAGMYQKLCSEYLKSKLDGKVNEDVKCKILGFEYIFDMMINCKKSEITFSHLSSLCAMASGSDESGYDVNQYITLMNIFAENFAMDSQKVDSLFIQSLKEAKSDAATKAGAESASTASTVTNTSEVVNKLHERITSEYQQHEDKLRSEQEQRESAIIRIQMLEKRRKLRERIQTKVELKEKNAAIIIESLLRVGVEKKLTRELKAAIRIESLLRVGVAKKLTSNLRSARDVRAAILINKNLRCHLQKNTIKQRKMQLMKEHLQVVPGLQWSTNCLDVSFSKRSNAAIDPAVNKMDRFVKKLAGLYVDDPKAFKRLPHLVSWANQIVDKYNILFQKGGSSSLGVAKLDDLLLSQQTSSPREAEIVKFIVLSNALSVSRPQSPNTNKSKSETRARAASDAKASQVMLEAKTHIESILLGDLCADNLNEKTELLFDEIYEKKIKDCICELNNQNTERARQVLGMTNVVAEGAAVAEKQQALKKLSVEEIKKRQPGLRDYVYEAMYDAGVELVRLTHQSFSSEGDNSLQMFEQSHSIMFDVSKNIYGIIQSLQVQTEAEISRSCSEEGRLEVSKRGDIKSVISEIERFTGELKEKGCLDEGINCYLLKLVNLCGTIKTAGTAANSCEVSSNGLLPDADTPVAPVENKRQEQIIFDELENLLPNNRNLISYVVSRATEYLVFRVGLGVDAIDLPKASIEEALRRLDFIGALVQKLENYASDPADLVIAKYEAQTALDYQRFDGIFKSAVETLKSKFAAEKSYFEKSLEGGAHNSGADKSEPSVSDLRQAVSELKAVEPVDGPLRNAINYFSTIQHKSQQRARRPSAVAESWRKPNLFRPLDVATGKGINFAFAYGFNKGGLRKQMLREVLSLQSSSNLGSRNPALTLSVKGQFDEDKKQKIIEFLKKHAGCKKETYGCHIDKRVINLESFNKHVAGVTPPEEKAKNVECLVNAVKVSNDFVAFAACVKILKEGPCSAKYQYLLQAICGSSLEHSSDVGSSAPGVSGDKADAFGKLVGSLSPTIFTGSDGASASDDSRAESPDSTSSDSSIGPDENTAVAVN